MPLVDVDRLKAGGQKFATGFTTGQKVMSVLGVAALGLGLLTFSKMSATTNYSPLYSNLNPKDTGDITKALDTMKVPYKLSDGGNSILVPQANLYKARVDLSSKGLPANNDGYSLLDKGGITTSSFLQNVNYQRAVQRELSNTIMAFHGVNSASVNLALPSDDPFVGASEKKTTAAVQVDTGSMQMQTEQIQSIVHLVAASVKDLSPNAITVADTNGHLLYSGDQNGAFADAQSLSKQMKMEDAMRMKIEATLRSTLGVGHYAVTANIQLDSSQRTKTVESSKPVIDPSTSKPVEDSSTIKKTSLTSQGQGTSGVLGTTPGGVSTPSKEVFVEDTKTHTTPIDKTIEQIKIDGGVVTKQSYSVALDRKLVTDTDVPKYKDLIAGIVGLDATRNDTLVVQSMPMDKDIQKVSQDSFAKTATAKPVTPPLDIFGIARYVATMLIVAIVLFMAWRSVKKAQAAMGPARTPIDLVLLEAQQLQQQQAQELAMVASGLGELPVGSRMPGAPQAIESSRSNVELEVVDLIERKPEEVAQTLRSWLGDRRG